MASINTTHHADVRLSVDLDDDEVFDYVERWGSRRTFRIRRLYATGNPKTGRLDNSVSLYGPNLKKDGTEGQQRSRYNNVQIDSLSGSVRAQLAEAFAKTCRDLADEVQNGAFKAADVAAAVVA